MPPYFYNENDVWGSIIPGWYIRAAVDGSKNVEIVYYSTGIRVVSERVGDLGFKVANSGKIVKNTDSDICIIADAVSEVLAKEIENERKKNL